MDSTIIAALIGVAGTIIGKISFTKAASWFFRSQHNIPDIKGTQWSCEWYFENSELYVKDEIRIVKWTQDGRFKGVGRQEKKRDPTAHVFEYPITGEVSPTRVVVLTYKAEKYPTEGHIGMACMELNMEAKEMLGHWCGMASKKLDDGTKISTLRHGKVKCIKRA
jgi:hypothetical protein